MANLHESRHVSVSIQRRPDEVYEFVSNPKNLPAWATGLAGAIVSVGGEWIADSPVGKIKIRFADANPFGVLDHDVILESGAVIHNPMRVVPNGNGSEVIFSLFRLPDVSEPSSKKMQLGWPVTFRRLGLFWNDSFIRPQGATVIPQEPPDCHFFGLAGTE